MVGGIVRNGIARACAARQTSGELKAEDRRLAAGYGSPERVADIRIERFELADECFDLRARRGVLVWAGLLLADITAKRGVTTQVLLLNQAERTNELQRHLIHLQLGIDGRELAVEDQVHQ